MFKIRRLNNAVICTVQVEIFINLMTDFYLVCVVNATNGSCKLPNRNVLLNKSSEAGLLFSYNDDKNSF